MFGLVCGQKDTTSLGYKKTTIIVLKLILYVVGRPTKAKLYPKQHTTFSSESVCLKLLEVIEIKKWMKITVWLVFC